MAAEQFEDGRRSWRSRFPPGKRLGELVVEAHDLGKAMAIA